MISVTDFSPHRLIPEGFIYDDGNALERKIVDFVSAGAASLHIIFDFDRTLTVRKPGVDGDITTWNILCDHLPQAGQQQYKALYDKYRALEVAETMTDADAVEWWTLVLRLFVRYEVSIKSVELDFLKRASIRPGTVELFQACHKQGIPTVIMSAGIYDIINLWSRKYHIVPTLTLSTRLKFDNSGTITGWEEDTLIHALNKHEADHPELLDIRSQRPKAIILGDGMGDADMAPDSMDVMKVRVYDPRIDEVVNIEQVRSRTFERFDAMIESENFVPLQKLVRLIVDGLPQD